MDCEPVDLQPPKAMVMAIFGDLGRESCGFIDRRGTPTTTRMKRIVCALSSAPCRPLAASRHSGPPGRVADSERIGGRLVRSQPCSGFAVLPPTRSSMRTNDSKLGGLRRYHRGAPPPAGPPSRDRLLARPWAVLEPTKAVLGKAPPPVADNDNARLDTHLLGNRTHAATLRRQQHYARPLHVALRCRRCPAASLKHLAYFRLEPNLSCFGNHPDLKS